LIELFFIDLQTVEKTIKKGKEKTLKSLRSDSRYKLIENTISELQNWVCFRKDSNEKKKGKAVNEKKKRKKLVGMSPVHVEAVKNIKNVV